MYGATGPCSQDVIKKRRSRIKEALIEIGKLDGWVFRLQGTHVFISRPKELSKLDKCELSPGDIAEFELEILEDLYQLSER